MRTRYVFSCGILVAALAAGGPASAEDAMTDTAKDLFLKGARAAEQQKWDQCRAALLAALAIKPHPQIAGNLAGCELKLKLYRDAAEHLTYFLRELKPDAPAERRANGEAALREARAKVESIRLAVNVAGAEVRVDGRVVGRAPLVDPLFVDPGSHTIEALQEGFPAARATVEATPGGDRALALELKKSEPPPPPPPPPVKESWRPGVAVLVTGGVLAAGGLAMGIGLTIAANAKRADADRLAAMLPPGGPVCTGVPAPSVATTCTALKDAAASRDALSKGAVAGYVIGGAFALATGGLGLWAAKPQKGERTQTGSVRILPFAGAGGGGLVVMGGL
jgi:hypothetical protein